jgi:ABC-2 type transport system ATP-binding protein
MGATPALELRGLTKRYGARTVVEGLSLEVPAGSIFGLLGPNGSGKTTTLSCALGLLRPTAGTARVLGEPVARIHRLQGRLGVVFDAAIALPGLTVTQNLAYVRRLLGHRRGRTDGELLEAVGLTGHARQRAGSLSLGQQKRLALAAALLGEPELIVLDEPLSGLDTLGVRRMLRLFRSLREEGLTILLSSHRLHEMQTVVTHAGILLDGGIARTGPLDELLGRGAGRHRFTVGDPRRAREALLGLPGVEEVSAAEEDTIVEVRLAGVTAWELNRRLVEAGVEVHASEPGVETLQGLFERLVDEREAEEVA